MDKIIKYKILPNEKLILEYVKGKATWNDYMNMKKQEFTDPLYNSAYDIITDIRELHTDFSLNLETEILNYVEYLSLQRVDLIHKASILTNTPKQFLHAEFFKMKSIGLPVKTQTFSTYKSALDYLQIRLEKQQTIINYLEGMKSGNP